VVNDLLATGLVLFVASVALAMVAQRHARAERMYLWAAFAAHVLGAVAQIWITQSVYEGGGDMMNYMSEGRRLGMAMEIDPGRFGVDWFNLLFQRNARISMPFVGEGNSTGSMSAIAAALWIVTRHSLYASCILVGFCALLGRIALYRVFRDTLAPELRPRLLVAVLLVPSVVLWSSGVVKEGVAIAGIGAAVYGLHRTFRGRWGRGLTILGMGVMAVALVKPYILFPLAAAAATWIWADRVAKTRRADGSFRVRPAYLLMSAALAFGGVVLLGQLFPQYSIDNLGGGFATAQANGAYARGGSYYTMGEETNRSLGGQLLFAPLALATALFRPLIFEVTSPLALVNALEATVIAFLAISSLARLRLRASFSLLVSRPVLAASVVFTLLCGLAVGLATTNFGSLSRYRAPLMPFYAAVVVVMGARVTRATRDTRPPVKASQRPGPLTRPAQGRSARSVRSRLSGT